MAYYDPDNLDDQSYDPYQNTQQDTASIKRALFTTAKTMAAFAALHMVGQLSWRAISGLGAKGLARYSTTAAGIVEKTGANTIGGILKNTSIGKAFRAEYDSWLKPLRPVMAERAAAIQAARAKGPMAGAVASFTTAFKNPRTFIGTVGRAWKKNVLSSTFVSYVIDSATGVTGDLGIQEKKWYDVPGQIGNYAKWLAYDSVYTLGLTGSLKALKAAGGALGIQISKAFQGPMGRDLVRMVAAVKPGLPKGSKVDQAFNKEVLDVANSNYQQHFVSRALHGIMSFGESANGIIRNLNEAIEDIKSNVGTNFFKHEKFETKVKRDVFDPVARALENIKEIWHSNKKHLATEYSEAAHPGIAALEMVASLTNKIRTQHNVKLGDLPKQFGDLARIHEKKNLLDEIFGLEPLRVRDVVNKDWYGQQLGILKERTAGGAGEILMGHIMNMRIGQGYYKPHGGSIVGGGVNLGMFDPLANIRRITNAFLLKSFRIPFIGIDINVGDMIGTNSYLTESPEVTFWTSKRSYKLGPDAAAKLGKLDIFPGGRSPVSTADVTDDVWMTTYVNGKLSFLTDKDTFTIDWNRKLMFDYAGGARRRNENAWIKNKAAANSAANIRKDRRPVHNSWIGRFLDWSGLSLPTRMGAALDAITARIQGRNILYKNLAGVMSGNNWADWHKYADVAQNLRIHAGQDFIHILKNKEALSIIADCFNATQRGQLYDIMTTTRGLRQRLSDLQGFYGEEGWSKWLAKRGIQEEVEMITAYPKIAGKHISTKRMGLSRELSIEDRVRLEIIDDFFSTNFNSAAGQRTLKDAIPALLKRGIINEKTAKSIRLFSDLSAYVDTGVFGTGFRPMGNDSFMEILRDARLTAKKMNANIQMDIIDYIKDRKFRSSSLRQIDFQSERASFPVNRSPYVSVAKDPFSFGLEAGGAILDSVTNMMRELLIPFRKDPTKHFGLAGNLKYLTGSMLKIAGANFAFKTVDALLAANPLLDNTSLDNGIIGMVADGMAATRLFTSRILDAVGVTGVAKHLNGLLPGFTTSAPGAIVGAVVSRTMGGGPMQMATWFAKGALANRLLSPFLPDFTKTYEQLQDEYNGRVEVPIMKNPMWLMGSTPWEGSKVEGYTPNWYVQAKSRWKETDTLYGSVFRKWLHEPLWPIGISIGDIVDPYFMERKHYFSRPYPKTGNWGEEIPLIGPLIAGTFGRIMKPPKTMHQEFLEGSNDQLARDTYPFANPPPTVAEGLGMMHHNWGLRTMRGRSTLFGTFQYKDPTPWSSAFAEETLYNIQNFAGLKGFLAGSISERIFNRPLVMPTLETAGRIASQSRAFYDKNLGGLGIMTEPIRRIIEKPDSRKYGINPIPNMMPDWLPQEFLTGDPYAKIIRGELRLPGAAYAATHTGISRRMPARASMFGAPEEHMIQYFTGLLPPMLKEEYDILNEGTTIHAQVQDMLAAEGLLIQAEKLVYDEKNDISGHVDAIIKEGTGGGGRKALEIKTISAKGFAQLSGPKDQHVGQLNFYLKQLGLRKGTLLYINRENPSEIKTYEIGYSKSRYERDIAKLNKVRQIATNMMAEGINDDYGFSYSWLDRLKILADVAPLSKEFKEAKYIVQQQIRSNLLTQKEITEYETAIKHRQARIRRYELYPLRFKGKVMSPDTEKNIQSINEDIKAAKEYALPERAIGAIWETFTNSNNFISNKFFAFKDPLEHYKYLKLYGKEFRPWDDVWGSFAEPYIRGALSKTDPIGGAYSMGMIGYSLGGQSATVLGAFIGSIYGTVNGLIRSLTDTAYIPKVIQEQREINRYFDVAKFERYSRMAQLSEGLAKQEFVAAQNATLTAFNKNGQDIANLFRATPYMEKPYISAWLGENNPKRRQEILRYIPTDLGEALKKQWATNDNKEYTSIFNRNSSAEIAAGYNGPEFDRSILDPSVMLEDIKLKTIEEAGLNAHDFGLGWNEQLLRMQENYNNIAAAKVTNLNTEGFSSANISSSNVRYMIQEQMRAMGMPGTVQVYINNGADDVNVVQLNIKSDRSDTIIRALTNRRKYLG